MLQENCRRTARGIIPVLVFLILVFTQIALVSAANNFDEILEPLQTIYDLVKYTATIIAGLIMLFAGITYITSGSNAGKRDKAKNMVMYVIIGLMVIWAAPFVVDLILNN